MGQNKSTLYHCLNILKSDTCHIVDTSLVWENKCSIVLACQISVVVMGSVVVFVKAHPYNSFFITMGSVFKKRIVGVLL